MCKQVDFSPCQRQQPKIQIHSTSLTYALSITKNILLPTQNYLNYYSTLQPINYRKTNKQLFHTKCLIKITFINKWMQQNNHTHSWARNKNVSQQGPSPNTVNLLKHCYLAHYQMVAIVSCSINLTFTFMHLADAFIQSDLHCIQGIHFFQYVCSLGIEPTTFCAANTMLYHWATGIPVKLPYLSVLKRV